MNYWLLGIGIFLLVAVLGILFALLLLAFLKRARKTDQRSVNENEDKNIGGRS